MTVRVYSDTGRLVREFTDVPDDTDLLLELAAQAMAGDPDQVFKVRIEDANQHGYWMIVNPAGMERR